MNAEPTPWACRNKIRTHLSTPRDPCPSEEVRRLKGDGSHSSRLARPRTTANNVVNPSNSRAAVGGPGTRR